VKLRLLIGFPIIIAAALTLLMFSADYFHLARREHFAGYGFLFASPWAWLIDELAVHQTHNRTLESVVTYIELLWIPALLYSVSLGLLVRLLGLMRPFVSHR
jgi:hypothetical protein